MYEISLVLHFVNDIKITLKLHLHIKLIPKLQFLVFIIIYGDNQTLGRNS